MKAIVYRKYGPPEVLKFEEVEKPIPKKDEVLVKVHAATVNRTDCAMLRAKPFIMRFLTGLFKPANPILGTEFAGRVEAVGKDVSSFRIGDRVFGFDDIGLSTYAEYLTISQNQALTTIPENTTYEQAAASTEGAHYAINFINKVSIHSADKVMVNGASGGIGSAMVQLLKVMGAEVTATCQAKNVELVRSLGANRVIDYEKDDFTQDDQKYGFVFDSVGKSSFGKCKRLLQPGGVYISSELGWMSENLFFALFTPLIAGLPGLSSNRQVKFPYPADKPGSVLKIKKLMEQGSFKAVIDRTYPLEKIAEAFDYVEKGQKTGNVVIEVKK